MDLNGHVTVLRLLKRSLHVSGRSPEDVERMLSSRDSSGFSELWTKAARSLLGRPYRIHETPHDVIVSMIDGMRRYIRKLDASAATDWYPDGWKELM
jgi:hypothetical protein